MTKKRPPGEDRRALDTRAAERLGGTPRGLRVIRRSGGDALTNDEFDVAAANADVAQFAIVEARQSANGFAIAAPRVQFLGDGLNRGHEPLLFFLRSVCRLCASRMDDRLGQCVAT